MIGDASKIRPVARRKVIKHHHFLPLGKQVFDKVRTDEPRATGNAYSHSHCLLPDTTGTGRL